MRAVVVVVGAGNMVEGSFLWGAAVINSVEKVRRRDPIGGTEKSKVGRGRWKPASTMRPRFVNAACFILAGIARGKKGMPWTWTTAAAIMTAVSPSSSTCKNGYIAVDVLVVIASSISCFAIPLPITITITLT